MTTSIQDVAQKAGVSISTVSRSFTRPDLVSTKTRERVLAIADELNFSLSRSAAALKSGRSLRIAVLMSGHIRLWFTASVIEGLNEVLHAAGYDISVFQISSIEERREFFEMLPVRRNADAVIVVSFDIDNNEITQLASADVPIIGINTPSSESFDATISIDDEKGMYTAAQHLINLGHKHIVYPCSEAAGLDSSIDARAQGFINACKDAEGKHDINWEVLSVPRGPAFADSALSALLAMDEFPDAICCQMDMMAIPLVLKLERYGHRTPRDYSIVGFDDSPYADTINLTTMRQDPYAMGRAAANKALTLISGKTLYDPHEVLEAQLVPRSTDIPFGEMA